VAEAKILKFSASVSGTYTTHGQVTNSDCSPPPSYQTATLSGEATETATFKTTRRAVVVVQSRPHGHPSVTLLHTSKPIKGSASISRSSTLDGRTDPQGCSGSHTHDCGTRALGLRIGMGSYSKGHTFGLVPDLSGPAAKSPFEACPLTVGQASFPIFIGGDGYAKVSPSTLLRRHKLVLSGGRQNSDSEHSSYYDASGSYDLRYKITLKR
jgi:hypothetical protein